MIQSKKSSNVKQMRLSMTNQKLSKNRRRFRIKNNKTMNHLMMRNNTKDHWQEANKLQMYQQLNQLVEDPTWVPRIRSKLLQNHLQAMWHPSSNSYLNKIVKASCSLLLIKACLMSCGTTTIWRRESSSKLGRLMRSSETLTRLTELHPQVTMNSELNRPITMRD